MSAPADSAVPVLVVDHHGRSHDDVIRNLPNGTRLYAAPQPPAEAQPVAWRILWSPDFPETCELTSDGERVLKVQALDDPPYIQPLYAAPAETQAQGGGEIPEAELIALVAGPYHYHHKMDEAAEREGKAFDRCRELTIQNIRTWCATRRAMLHTAPPSAPVGVDGPPKGWNPCSRCRLKGKSDDCERCGGSGWRKKCNALDCLEYGCNSYGFCIVTKDELAAALAQQPAADTVTVQQAWEWAGGNPGIKATREDLQQALRDLDAVCDVADQQPAASLNAVKVPEPVADGQNGNVRVIEAARDAFPAAHPMYAALDHAAAELAALDATARRQAQQPAADKVPGCEDCAHNGRYLCDEHGQQQPAAIPRLANCGKYTATDNNGQHYYLNHANTWQTFQGQQPAAVDGFDLDCPHSAIGGCDLCAAQPGGDQE